MVYKVGGVKNIPKTVYMDDPYGFCSIVNELAKL